MVEQVDPGGHSPAREPDGQPREPDAEQDESAPGRRGRAWVLTVAGAWSAMAVVGLTVGRPELAMVTHIAVRAVSGAPFSGVSFPMIAAPAANPSAVPRPSGGPSSVQEGILRGDPARVTHPSPSTVAASSGQPSPSASPTASATPSPTSQPPAYGPPPSPGPTTSSPASSPSATGSAPPSQTPTGTTSPTPTYSASATATDSPNCLQSVASSTSVSSVISSLLNCPSSLPGLP